MDSARHRKALALLDSSEPQLAHAAKELLVQDEQLKSYRTRLFFEEQLPMGTMCHGERAHRLAESIQPVQGVCTELSARCVH